MAAIADFTPDVMAIWIQTTSEVKDGITVRKARWSINGVLRTRNAAYRSHEQFIYDVRVSIARELGHTRCPGCGCATIPEMKTCSSCEARYAEEEYRYHMIGDSI